MTRKFEGPIVGFSGEKITLAQAEIARLTEENEALRDRLEIFPETHLDGIDARDETIRLQEAELLRLRAETGDADAYWYDPNYASLRAVLSRAYAQAAKGKGAERHAQDLPFDEQPMQVISHLLGTHQGLLYQAIKKTQESTRLPTDRAVAELLGAVNYLAGAVIYLETEK
jgi:hypothetical protein